MTPSDHWLKCRDHLRRRVGYPSVGAKTLALAPRAAPTPIGQYNCPHQSDSTTVLTNSNQAPRTNTTGSLPAPRVSQPFTSPDVTAVNHHRPHPPPTPYSHHPLRQRLGSWRVGVSRSSRIDAIWRQSSQDDRSAFISLRPRVFPPETRVPCFVKPPCSLTALAVLATSSSFFLQTQNKPP